MFMMLLAKSAIAQAGWSTSSCSRVAGREEGMMMWGTGLSKGVQSPVFAAWPYTLSLEDQHGRGDCPVACVARRVCEGWSELLVLSLGHHGGM